MLMITKMSDDSDDEELAGTKQKGVNIMRMTILELSDDSDDDELVGTKQKEGEYNEDDDFRIE